MKISIKKYLIVALLSIYPAALSSMELPEASENPKGLLRGYFIKLSVEDIKEWCIKNPGNPSLKAAQEVLDWKMRNSPQGVLENRLKECRGLDDSKTQNFPNLADSVSASEINKSRNVTPSVATVVGNPQEVATELPSSPDSAAGVGHHPPLVPLSARENSSTHANQPSIVAGGSRGEEVRHQSQNSSPDTPGTRQREKNAARSLGAQPNSKDALAKGNSKIDRILAYAVANKGKIALGIFGAAASADLICAYIKVRTTAEWQEANMRKRCILLPCKTKTAKVIRNIYRRIS